MKKYFKYIFALVSTAVLTNACDDKLVENFEIGKSTTSSVSTSGISGPLTKKNETITIPISIKLDKPADQAFEVKLFVNQDSLTKLFDKGDLNGLTPVPSNYISIPNVAKVSYGSDSAQFTVEISRTVVEANFNKDMVFGYSIAEPGKGNKINNSKNFQLIQFNTGGVIQTPDIHYIYIRNNPAGIINANNRANYSSTSSGVTVPIGAALASFPGNPFRVTTKVNTDTIAKMVTAGILPQNTIALQPNEYNLNSTINFGSNQSQADFNLSVNWNIIERYQDKNLAVFVELDKSTMHVIDTTRNYVVVLIDASIVLEVDITNNGVFSVSRDHRDGPTHGEGSPKLIDNNINSKFLQHDYDGTLWAQIVYDTPQKIAVYTITSANDAKERDPNIWHLDGSNDGVNWVTIDSRVNVDFQSRFLTKRFNVTNPREFTHYRIYFTHNVGSNLIQIAEWRVYKSR